MKNLLILCSLVCVLAGCNTTNTYERAESRAQTNVVQDKRIVTDINLNSYAYVYELNEAVVNDLLKVQAKLVNCTTSRRSINYKFVWFDENGMEVSSITSPWQILIMEGGEYRTISAIAPKPNVVDFSLKMTSNK